MNINEFKNKNYDNLEKVLPILHMPSENKQRERNVATECRMLLDAATYSIIKIPKIVVDLLDVYLVEFPFNEGPVFDKNTLQLHPKMIYQSLYSMMLAMTYRFHGYKEDIYKLIRENQFPWMENGYISDYNLQQKIDELVSYFYKYWISSFIKYESGEYKYSSYKIMSTKFYVDWDLDFNKQCNYFRIYNHIGHTKDIVANNIIPWIVYYSQKLRILDADKIKLAAELDGYNHHLADDSLFIHECINDNRGITYFFKRYKYHLAEYTGAILVLMDMIKYQKTETPTDPNMDLVKIIGGILEKSKNIPKCPGITKSAVNGKNLVVKYESDEEPDNIFISESMAKKISDDSNYRKLTSRLDNIQE